MDSADGTPRAVILVEGTSDRRAVEALAARCGRDLIADGVVVVAMGGSKNAARFLEHYGPRGLDVELSGLYDSAEERDVARGLERAGLGANLSRADMQRLGFHACVADLEDELIRALGATEVERVIASSGELQAFRLLQGMPQWRSRPVEEQLRRFLGTRGGRKIASAPLLVAALDLARVPPPLERLLGLRESPADPTGDPRGRPWTPLTRGDSRPQGDPPAGGAAP